MKKVLIISFSFPPSSNIGARRPFGFAKYLPKFGWEPIVLTPELPGRSIGKIKVIETDYKDVISFYKSKFGLDPQKGLQEQFGIDSSKNQNHPTWKGKFIELVKGIITYPDANKGWYNFALKEAYKFLDTEKVDLIISTAPPIVTHLIASKLKNKYKIPWIADFRDLWSQDTLYVEKSKVRQYAEKKLELLTLKSSDAIITVCEPHAEQLKILHSSLREKIFVITNGFDPADFDGLHENRSDKFLITYTGSLYGSGRDPSPLFIAIRKLIDENKIDPAKIEIKFYASGNFPEILAEKYELVNVVKVYDRVSYSRSLENQINSTVLLIVEWAPEGKGEIYTGKIFEYLGARRPILAIAPEDSIISDLLTKTESGFATINSSGICNIIQKWYDQFIMFGNVNFYGNDDEIQKYYRENKTRELSMIMSSIVKHTETESFL